MTKLENFQLLIEIVIITVIFNYNDYIFIVIATRSVCTMWITCLYNLQILFNM